MVLFKHKNRIISYAILGMLFLLFQTISTQEVSGATVSTTKTATTNKITSTVSIKNVNQTNGKFDVLVSNIVSKNGVKTVQVPVWSTVNGQNDIIWYTATKQKDGTYKVTVDISKHKYENGEYNAHVYITPNSGVRQYSSSNKVKITTDLYKNKIAKVQEMLKNKYNKSNYGIYVKYVNSNYSAGINQDVVYTAASTGKLPAIYYTQKKLNNKTISLNNNLKYVSAVNTFSGSYASWGAGVLPKTYNNKNYTLQTVLYDTIHYSDNVGANLLGYYVGNQYDAKFVKEMSSIIGKTWSKTPKKASAKDNALIMQAIYKLGGKANEYLKDTVYDNERIPKYIPVPVGHKIGDLYDLRHDVAVVYSSQPYVISVMTKNNTSYETISKISLDVYNIMK